MKKNQNDYPSHIRTNHDKFIHYRIDEAKKVLREQHKKTNISDREALRFLLSNSNNGNPSDVIDSQVKILRHGCCMYIPRMRQFPFTQLEQIMNFSLDDIGVLSFDEVKQGFMGIIAQGNVKMRKKNVKEKKE